VNKALGATVWRAERMKRKRRMRGFLPR
jgi:hypothetical protein